MTRSRRHSAAYTTYYGAAIETDAPCCMGPGAQRGTHAQGSSHPCAMSSRYRQFPRQRVNARVKGSRMHAQLLHQDEPLAYAHMGTRRLPQGATARRFSLKAFSHSSLKEVLKKRHTPALMYRGIPKNRLISVQAVHITAFWQCLRSLDANCTSKNLARKGLLSCRRFV